MGTDIHMRVEYRPMLYEYKNNRLEGYTGEWYSADLFRMPVKGENSYRVVELWENRDYGLFATLANVRNYGDTVYIDTPRGLPDDSCEYIKKELGDCNEWGHSASYFTLKELYDFYKKYGEIRRSGMISPADRDRLDIEGITPESWCQGTNQEGWERREWTEKNWSLERLINKLKIRAEELGMCYDFDFERNNDRAISAMENIRIVFCFDS